MTGQYAWRKKGTDILPGDASLIIPPGTATLPAIFKKAGYVTGMVGKWHLGLGNSPIDWNKEIKPGPGELGFDYQFYLPATLDRVPCVFLEGHRVLSLLPGDPLEVNYHSRIGPDPTGWSNPEMLLYKPDAQHSGTIVNGVSRIGYMKGGYAARWSDEGMIDVLTHKAVGFMEANKDKPFFLYFAMVEPHVPRLPNPRFAGKTALGPRGDVIVQLDWGVGEVLKALDRLGLSQDSLVVFTSDNGPVLYDGYLDGSVARLGTHRPAGPFRGGKYDALEGGTRVPFIARWPKRIKPGQSAALMCQMDFPAMMAALTGQSLEKGACPDGVNTLDALLGESPIGRTSLVEQGYLALGLRAGNWKLLQANGNEHPSTEKMESVPHAALYNLADDPMENHDLSKQHPEKLEAMRALLQKIRDGDGDGTASDPSGFVADD